MYKYKTRHSGGVSKQKHKKKSIISKTAAKLALMNDTTPTGKNVIKVKTIAFHMFRIKLLHFICFG